MEQSEPMTEPLLEASQVPTCTSCGMSEATRVCGRCRMGEAAEAFMVPYDCARGRRRCWSLAIAASLTIAIVLHLALRMINGASEQELVQELVANRKDILADQAHKARNQSGADLDITLLGKTTQRQPETPPGLIGEITEHFCNEHCAPVVHTTTTTTVFYDFGDAPTTFIGMWLDFWKRLLVEHGSDICFKAIQEAAKRDGTKLSMNTCKEVVGLAVDMRWKLYLMCAGTVTCIMLLLFCAWELRSCERPVRPNYWKHTSWGCKRFTDRFYKEIDVTEEIGSMVQALIDEATDRRRMGKGYDGDWARNMYDAFEVVQVIRIENGPLWSAYDRHLKSTPYYYDVRRKLSSEEDKANFDKGIHACCKAEEWKRSPSQQAKYFLKSLGLDTYRNEVLLFHGCPDRGARNPLIKTPDNPLYDKPLFTAEDSTSPVQAVKKQGFDARISKLEGMLGAGTYFADMASKADCYAGKYKPLGENEVGEIATMFLARVALGAPYFTDQALEQMRRPPCIRGHFDIALHGITLPERSIPWERKGVSFNLCDHRRFNSVISDRSMKPNGKLYNEFVIYGEQAYPEFCVKYRRVRRYPERSPH